MSPSRTASTSRKKSKTDTSANNKPASPQIQMCTLLENAQEIFWIVDGQGVLLYANPSLERLLGRSREEFIGRPYSDFSTLVESESIFDKLKDPSFNKFKVELRCTHSDGHLVVLETRGFVHRDPENNKIVRIEGVSRDITKPAQVKIRRLRYRTFLKKLVRRRTYQLRMANKKLVEEIEQKRKTEEALNRAHNELRMIFNATSVALRIIDGDFNVIRLNEKMAALCGLSVEKAIGTKCYDTFPGDYCHTKKCTLTSIMLGRIPFQREDWRKAPNQPPMPCLVYVQPLFDNGGRFVGIVEDFTDITEIKRLRSIAEAVNTMDTIGYVFSGIRHELGNPINALKTTLTVLKKRLRRFTIDEISSYVNRSINDVGRVEFLLNSLKNFSMYERLNIEATSMKPFFSDCEKIVTPDAERQGINFFIVYSSKDEKCMADPRALQQVILNLVANSMDACQGRKDALIRIESVKERDSYKIIIRDNGKGIAPERMNEIFFPFYTTKERGTGLGLVIAKKMMVMMEGAIDISSEIGVGTEVQLKLPHAKGTK